MFILQENLIIKFLFRNQKSIMFKYLFCGLTFDFLLSSVVKRKANSTIEQSKCRSHEKRNQILVSKMVFSFEFSQRNKKFTYRHIFSFRPNLNNKSSSYFILILTSGLEKFSLFINLLIDTFRLYDLFSILF